MKGIRLFRGAVFVYDGLLTVKLSKSGECGPSPIAYPVLEWDLRTEPPECWEYMTESDIRALDDGGYEKITAAFEKMRSTLKI